MLDTPALNNGPMFCPKCGEPEVHRSHRRGRLEHLVSHMGWYPFRCTACGHRFSRWEPAAGLAPARSRRVVRFWVIGGLVFLAVAAIDLALTLNSRREAATQAPSALVKESPIVPSEATVSCGADGTAARTDNCFEIRFRGR